MRKSFMIKTMSLIVLTSAALGAGAAWRSTTSGQQPGQQSLDFGDIPARAREFIAYEASIELTAAQERLRMEALSRIEAPCCDSYSAYTCCCKCNLSRTIWGLSKNLIANQEADSESVERTVRSWIAAVNPSGFSGSACFQDGGCKRPFGKDGCGGMLAAHLIE